MTHLNKHRWEVLSPLFDAALELGPDARASWLEEQRRTDPALVAELEELLGREPVLEVAGFLGPRYQPEPTSATASFEGKVLGAWLLERLLGRGGMGTVWLARRQDGRFHGAAAIKFLSLAVADPVGEARFRREGSVLARLNHPNIARLLDAGVSPTGQPYLVLEYVDGEPLDVWCDRLKLSAEGRLRLFQQVLAAVDHAHARLIVHRDLKPSNILVTRDGTVKLLDFGIAKLLEGQEELTATAGQDRLLSFEHAAPEQIRGEPISVATDVYSLGVVLYQLLAGRHPTSATARTPAEHVRAILDIDAAQLSRAVTPGGPVTRDEAIRAAEVRDAAPERLRKAYVGDLDNILAKALRKDPAERYPGIAAFADDINRYLQHEPVSARPATLGYRSGKFLRRNRGAVTIAALVTLALLGATGTAAYQMVEAEKQRDEARLVSRQAEAQSEFQDILLTEVGDEPITMRQVVDRARGIVEQQYSDDPRFLATMLMHLADKYGELDDRKMRGELLIRAESVVVGHTDGEQLAQVRCHLADQLRTEGRYDEAWAAWGRIDSLLRDSRDPSTVALCLEIRSVLGGETGKAEGAIRDVRRAIAIQDSLGENSNMVFVGLLNSLSMALSEDSARAAITALERAIHAMDSTGRGGMLARTIMQHNLGLQIAQLGEIAQGGEILHGALLRQAKSDPGGRSSTQALIHYAETALDQGLPDSADKYFGVLVAQAIRDTNLYWEGRGLFGLTRAQIRLRRLDEARRSLARFVEVKALQPDVMQTDDQIPDAQVLEGWLALATGDVATAHADFLSALKTNRYFEGRRTRRLRPIIILAAESGLTLGHADEALGLAREARSIATQDSLSETQSAHVGEAHLIEAQAYLALGDTTEAHASLTAALRALRFGAGAEHFRTREAEVLAAELRK